MLSILRPTRNHRRRRNNNNNNSPSPNTRMPQPMPSWIHLHRFSSATGSLLLRLQTTALFHPIKPPVLRLRQPLQPHASLSRHHHNNRDSQTSL